MRFDTSIEPRPEFATLLYMQELDGSRTGKCVCDVAARLGADELSLYDDVAFMLASKWVTIERDSFETGDDFSERHDDALAASEAADSVLEKSRIWYEFFREVGGSEVVPDYFVKLSSLGKRKLKELRSAHIRRQGRFFSPAV